MSTHAHVLTQPSPCGTQNEAAESVVRGLQGSGFLYVQTDAISGEMMDAVRHKLASIFVSSAVLIAIHAVAANAGLLLLLVSEQTHCSCILGHKISLFLI